MSVKSAVFMRAESLPFDSPGRAKRNVINLKKIVYASGVTRFIESFAPEFITGEIAIHEEA